jgi:hypothetical protein
LRVSRGPVHTCLILLFDSKKKKKKKAEIAADKVAKEAIQAEKITAAAECHNSAIQQAANIEDEIQQQEERGFLTAMWSDKVTAMAHEAYLKEQMEVPTHTSTPNKDVLPHDSDNGENTDGLVEFPEPSVIGTDSDSDLLKHDTELFGDDGSSDEYFEEDVDESKKKTRKEVIDPIDVDNKDDWDTFVAMRAVREKNKQTASKAAEKKVSDLTYFWYLLINTCLLPGKRKLPFGPISIMLEEPFLSARAVRRNASSVNPKLQSYLWRMKLLLSLISKSSLTVYFKDY